MPARVKPGGHYFVMRTAVRRNSLAIERSWLDRGATLIAGTDEVGRGAWAGPVVAGMVALPSDTYQALPADLCGVDDSKLLTTKQRAALAPTIMSHVAWGLGAATSREIADTGLSTAVRTAIRRAYADLSSKLRRVPDILLTDAVRLPDAPLAVESHTKADQRCLSVAMASILAKVHRDWLMRRFDPVYPDYDFAGNKGYGTRRHQQALLEFGPCAIHRESFRPVMRAASQLLPATGSATHATDTAVSKRNVVGPTPEVFAGVGAGASSDAQAPSWSAER